MALSALFILAITTRSKGKLKSEVILTFNISTNWEELIIFMLQNQDTPLSCTKYWTKIH